MTHNHKQSIHQLIEHSYTQNKLLYLIKGFSLIVQQGRFLEAVYGIKCFLFHKPSPIVENSDFNVDEAIVLSSEYFQDKREEQEVIRTLIRNLTGERELKFLFHGYVVNQTGFVIGEYADKSARLFIKDMDDFSVIDFYQNDPGVRHIHSIICNNKTLFISTGDSKKYLDQWKLSDGKLVFERRMLDNCFGGFIAHCKIQDIFFGSDYSHRLNYIYCLETSEKNFFPNPAYKQWCAFMLPVNNRYIVCINQNMPGFLPERTISIFDTHTSSFIFCKGYSVDKLKSLGFY